MLFTRVTPDSSASLYKNTRHLFIYMFRIAGQTAGRTFNSKFKLSMLFERRVARAPRSKSLSITTKLGDFLLRRSPFSIVLGFILL